MPLQILVINEHTEFCDRLSDELSKAGQEVSCVQTYGDAVQAAALHRPALIILEISATDVGGVEMVTRLQRGSETRHIPIIVISDFPELEFELLDLFDFLLQPLDMGRLLEDVTAISLGRKQSRRRHTDALADDTYRLFYNFLLKESGLHFDRRNQKILERGILNRMGALKIGSYEAYYDYLVQHQESRQELKKLLPFLTIGETYFFRYHAHFEALARMLTQKRACLAPGEKLQLRLWSAGCSTGEEPYSLAMTVMEAVTDWQDHDISILATDIDNRALKRAREGVYGPWAMRVIDKHYLDRYFEKTGKQFRIRDDVKGLVRFAHHNLNAALPAGSAVFDAIFCRNVTIYFTIDVTRQIIEKLATCLKPSGYLFLGHSETMTQISTRFERQNHNGSFFYRKKTNKPATVNEAATAKLSPAPATTAQPPSEPAPLAAAPPPTPALPDWDNLHRLAQELFGEERFAESAGIVQNILEHRPDHTGALVISGFILANQGRFAEALAACERALAHDDLLAEAYLLKGLVFEMTERIPEAGEEYRKAILLEQDLVMAHYQLAQIHGRLGKARARARELKNTLKIVQGLKPEATVPHSGGMPRERFLSQVEKELAQAG